MTLGSTQPLVKMSTTYISGGKGGRCVRLTSPPSRAECHEIWEPKPPGTLWATPGLLRDSFTFTFYSSDILNDKSLIYSHKSATYMHDFLLYPCILQTVRIFDVAADTTTEHQFVLEQIMDTEMTANIITTLHDLLTLLHKQHHMKGKRKS